jgi:hypothetical protein
MDYTSELAEIITNLQQSYTFLSGNLRKVKVRGIIFNEIEVYQNYVSTFQNIRTGKI